MSPTSASRRRSKGARSIVFLTALSMMGCAAPASTRQMQLATATAASLRVAIPDLAREPCLGAPLPPPPTPTEADYQTFGVAQTGQLEICDTKRRLAVAAGDLANLYAAHLQAELKPATLWQRLTGDRVKRPQSQNITIDDILAYGDRHP